MNNREKLANGIIDEQLETQPVEMLVEWNVPEDNFFELKDKPRLDRMLKSERARTNRHMIREIKQNKHQLGYNGSVML